METVLKWSSCIIVFLVLSCNKKDSKAISTWVINRDTFFATPGVSKQKALCRMWVDGIVNNFRLDINLPYLPTSGELPIDGFTGISFYYNRDFYVISPYETGYLIASERNKKASYRLNPTWYVNYYDSNDSVLIQGTFNEP